VRADRVLAFWGFVLAVTSLLLPWWGATWTASGTTVRDPIAPFRPDPQLTTTWGPWASGILAGLAALVLFVRLAGQSHRHEPPAWRRDLVVSAILLAAAAALCLLWPSGVPAFWGGRTYASNGTAPTIVEVEMPLLGWFVALAAALLAGLARWQAGKPHPDPADPSTAGGTTGK